MKVLIVTLGTRGDVQPYVALGKGLQKAGYQVSLCTCQRFQSFVTEHGLNYKYMDDGIIQLIDTQQGKELIEQTSNFYQIIKANLKLAKKIAPLQRKAFEDSWEATQKIKPDLIIFHPKAYMAHQFAEKLNIPAVLAIAIPMLVPSAQKAHMGFPQLKLGKWYNLLTHKIVMKIMNLSIKKYIKEWREKNQMPPLAKNFNLLKNKDQDYLPTLFCYSEKILPPPTDWPQSAKVTGYWFLEEGHWEAPEELNTFLGKGEAPVYIGFGSMAGRRAEKLTAIIIKALQKAKVRGIIASGWGGLSPQSLPDTILSINKAPHHWLFPKVAAVVHHGGAGTTAAGLKAGRPTIICPFFGDQPFWGKQIYRLGVGPKPIPQKKLTVEKLAKAITESLSNRSIQDRAKQLGEEIKKENGIEEAIIYIKEILNITQNQQT